MDNQQCIQKRQETANSLIKFLTINNYVKLFILLTIILTSSIKSQANEFFLMLKDTPLIQSEINKTLTLFENDNEMGENSSISKFPQSNVSIAKNYIYSLKRKKAIGDLLPDTTRSGLYLVRVRFSLHELPEGKHYHKVTFHVDLGAKECVAFDLLPKNIFSKEDLTRTYSFTPELKFMEIGGKIGEFSETRRNSTEQPIISAFGEGESRFYWTYTCREGERVFPGTKDSYILLEVPRVTKFLNVKMAFEVIIFQDYFNSWLPKKTITETFSERWNLSDAQPIE